jgi:hypothetical protein
MSSWTEIPIDHKLTHPLHDFDGCQRLFLLFAGQLLGGVTATCKVHHTIITRYPQHPHSSSSGADSRGAVGADDVPDDAVRGIGLDGKRVLVEVGHAVASIDEGGLELHHGNGPLVSSRAQRLSTHSTHDTWGQKLVTGEGVCRNTHRERVEERDVGQLLRDRPAQQVRRRYTHMRHSSPKERG